MLTQVEACPAGQDYDGSPLYDCWICHRLVHKYQLALDSASKTYGVNCKQCDKEAKAMSK